MSTEHPPVVEIDAVEVLEEQGIQVDRPEEVSTADVIHVAAAIAAEAAAKPVGEQLNAFADALDQVNEQAGEPLFDTRLFMRDVVVNVRLAQYRRQRRDANRRIL
jgi:hypothetical protein